MATYHQGPTVGEAAETCRQAVYYHLRQQEQWLENGIGPDEIKAALKEHRTALRRLRAALQGFDWSPSDVDELFETASRKAAADVGGA